MVMPMDPAQRYTGQNGAVYVDGVLSQIFEEFDYNGDRTPDKIYCVGDAAARQFDGTYEPTLNTVINQTDWDFFVGLMTDTPLEGTATVAHAGIPDPTTTPEITAMTTADMVTPSRVRFQALTTAVTTPGKVVVYGTNATGVEISEVVNVPIMDINAYTLSTVQFFKTVTHVAAFTYVQAGGTMKVVGVAGDLTATVTAKSKRYTLLFQATRADGVRGILTITNCWPTKHQFRLGKPTEHMNPTIAWAIENPNVDVTFERQVVA